VTQGESPLSSVQAALLAWFDTHARDLPWRTHRTPYRVWISEAMLQQTRAATVIPYYERWMKAFPNVSSLAQASSDDVLAAWEGLGYYRRAHAILKAARIIAIERNGEFPTHEEDWLTLPGIGPYTAAAIAAFAHEQPTIAVDGNVRRVAARLLGQPTPHPSTIRSALMPLLPIHAPSRATEALIELGALVCTRRKPACHACPLAPACKAHRLGQQEAFPAPSKRPKAERRERFASVHLRDNQVWLERRPDHGLLAGLWGFPQTDSPPEGEPLRPVSHAYTHFTLHLTPVICSTPPRTKSKRTDQGWFHPDDLVDRALSTVDRRVLARLQAEGLLASSS